MTENAKTKMNSRADIVNSLLIAYPFSEAIATRLNLRRPLSCFERNQPIHSLLNSDKIHRQIVLSNNVVSHKLIYQKK